MQESRAGPSLASVRDFSPPLYAVTVLWVWNSGCKDRCFLDTGVPISWLREEMGIFRVNSVTGIPKGVGLGWVFTSRAVGINCCDSIEVGSLLWEILVSERASFFIDSYHPIPGEKKKGEKVFYSPMKLGFFSPSVCVFKNRQLKSLVRTPAGQVE